jgi:Ca2+/H+ antiporter
MRLSVIKFSVISSIVVNEVSQVLDHFCLLRPLDLTGATIAAAVGLFLLAHNEIHEKL